MIWPIYAFYVLCVGLIRLYKWMELQILRLFHPVVRHFIRIKSEKIGVVFHCQGDPEWTEVEEKRILSKCSRWYKTLIHLDVLDNEFFLRIANMGTIGFGESYMDKMVVVRGDPENITEMSKRGLESNAYNLYYNWWNRFLEWVELHAFNLQTRERAFQVGVEHYDLGNELYIIMLDPLWLQYTCGYWKVAKDLQNAQIDKLELIAKKLDLKPGMRVLDIGCGWGTLCKYLAEKYKVECVGVTIGEEGAKYGRNICKGLPVDIRVQDYREVNEQFDRIVSVGMFEHVGVQNYREFFTVARRCLKDEGLFLLHTIARNHNSKFPGRSDNFVNKHIFPNGNLPDPVDIAKATNGLFVIEDWHNFGKDYAKTLFCWRDNFIKGWPQIEKLFGERFYRMWTIYLSTARALFLARKLHLWQIVLSKDGLQRDYRASR